MSDVSELSNLPRMRVLQELAGSHLVSRAAVEEGGATQLSIRHMASRNAADPGDDDLGRLRRAISRRLKRLRDETRVSLEVLAEACGREKSTIQSWENPGNPATPNIVAMAGLCRVFGVSLDWMVRPVDSDVADDEDGQDVSETDANCAFVIDGEIVRRQLQSGSTSEDAWDLTAWFGLSRASYVVYGVESRDEVRRKIDEHFAKLTKERQP